MTNPLAPNVTYSRHAVCWWKSQRSIKANTKNVPIMGHSHTALWHVHTHADGVLCQPGEKAFSSQGLWNISGVEGLTAINIHDSPYSLSVCGTKLKSHQNPRGNPYSNPWQTWDSTFELWGTSFHPERWWIQSVPLSGVSATRHQPNQSAVPRHTRKVKWTTDQVRSFNFNIPHVFNGKKLPI